MLHESSCHCMHAWQAGRKLGEVLSSPLALGHAVETDAFGVRVCEELIPEGSSVPVTSANMLQVICFAQEWHAIT